MKEKHMQNAENTENNNALCKDMKEEYTVSNALQKTIKSLSLNINLPHNFKLHTSLYKYERVLGINSFLRNGNHIIMWDFDKVCLKKIVEVLNQVQEIYGLSDIFIISDENRYSYRAICFTQVDFRELLTILVDTYGEDIEHIIWTCKKRQATMRISKKKGRSNLKVVAYLHNRYNKQWEIPKELNFVLYETPIGDVLSFANE